MIDDLSNGNDSESRSWLEKLGQAFSGSEPRNRTELLEIVREAVHREILDADTLRMIEGALEVSEMQVRDAMIPRGQMVVVSGQMSLNEVLPVIVESGHSRFPVIKDDRDEVIGILLAKDLLRLFVEGSTEDFALDKLVRPAVFIPESKHLNMLLKDFRSSRNHMAIVVDEYGGVAGLITIEDVLEEIVGQIDDEHDSEEDELISAHDGHRYTISALTPIEDFNQHFGTEYSDEEFDTIGGLVTGKLGRLAEVGETIKLGDLEFEVQRADSRRLLTLGLTLGEQ